MIITTSDFVPGRQVTETLGVVSANAVRARNIGRDFMAGIKNITGGEIAAYRDLLNESRDEAMGRLQAQAEALGADAIVAMRMSTAAIMQGAAEILVYGTAVKLAP